MADTQVRRHGDGHLYVDVTRWEHLGFVEGAEVDVQLTLSRSTIILRSHEPEDGSILVRKAVGWMFDRRTGNQEREGAGRDGE